MKATILDTVTGKVATQSGPRSYEWAENQYSCDCNRNLWNIDTEKPQGYCEGTERFIIIHAEINDPADYQYTLRELNEGYPDELLDKYLPKNSIKDI